MNDDTGAGLREEVRSRYAGAALAVLSQSGEAGCCGETGGCGAPAGLSALTEGPGASLYRADETDGLPAEAVAASLGCGNPLAVADLNEGERVLDLGSGGGGERGRAGGRGVRAGVGDVLP